MRFRELTTEATGISPATLSSYKKKASAEASALDKDAFEKGGADAQAKLDKAHKRYKGINKATQKQFDNDANGVTESGPFSYGAKKPRKGSVADLAAQKRKEQERGRKAIEPKDHMVGNAKVTPTTCPSCHSADVKTYSDGEKECNHCHKTWDVQGVAEGSLEEVDRRGFLKGLGAACATGLAGCSIVDDVKEGKKRFINIKRGMTKSDVWNIMGGKELGLGPKRIKGSTGPWGEVETWEFNGVGSVEFRDNNVYIINYVSAPLNNYNESVEQGVTEGWKDKVGAAALAGTMALGSPAHSAGIGSSFAQGLGAGMTSAATSAVVDKKRNARDAEFAKQIPDETDRAMYLKAFKRVKMSRALAYSDPAMMGANAVRELSFKKLKQQLAEKYNITAPVKEEGVAEAKDPSAKIAALEKKIDAKQGSLEMAREKRKMSGKSKGVQSEREIKLGAEISKLRQELHILKNSKQGVAEGSTTKWEVSYDYGPHMTKTVTVKAGSEEEATAKVEKAAEKRGLSIMINSVTPVEQGVAEMDSHGYTGTRDKKSHSTYGNRDRDEVLTGPDVHLGPESLMTKKDVVKHGVSALRKAWDKALDTKPVSPQQQQRNKERWAKRQAEKNKPVQEGIDDELQQLTGNYRALMLGGGLDAAGKQKLRVVYDLLRDPIMQGDKEEYEKMHAYVSGKYPDLFDLLVGADDYVKGVDEASLATMRDYFAGDENAKDEMKITQMRKYYANDAAKEKTKKFNSLASYHHWLKQVGAEKINRK